MKKRTLIAVLALLGVSAAIGTTVAFLSDSVNFNNDFHLAKGETEFVETFKSPDNWKSCDTTQKELVITNKSDVPVVARFKMEEYWKRNGSTSSDHTNEISPTYHGYKVAIINFQNQNDWEQKGEWYVYKNVLQKNESTSSLLASVTFNCAVNMAGAMSYSQDGKSATTGVNDYANAHFHLNITAQTIQSGNQDGAWTVSTFAPGSYASKLGYDKARAAKTLAKSTSAPDANQTTIDVTETGSDKPIVMWLDGDTMYWYSEANEVYLPENSQYLFMDWTALESVPGLASINTSKVTNMRQIFDRDAKFSDPSGLASWDVSKVTNFSYAFSDHVFTSLDAFRNWDMSSATAINSMFNIHATQTSYLTDVSPLANWVVSNVTSMEYFMSNHPNIDATVLENWDVHANDKSSAFMTTPKKPSWAR